MCIRGSNNSVLRPTCTDDSEEELNEGRSSAAASGPRRPVRAPRARCGAGRHGRQVWELEATGARTTAAELSGSKEQCRSLEEIEVLGRGGVQQVEAETLSQMCKPVSSIHCIKVYNR